MDNIPAVNPRRRGLPRPLGDDARAMPALVRQGGQQVVEGAHVGLHDERAEILADLLEMQQIAPRRGFDAMARAARVRPARLGARAARPHDAAPWMGDAVRGGLLAGAALGVVVAHYGPDEWQLFSMGLATALGAAAVERPWQLKVLVMVLLGFHSLTRAADVRHFYYGVAALLLVGRGIVTVGRWGLHYQRARNPDWVMIQDVPFDAELREAVQRVAPEVRAFLQNPVQFEDIDDFDPLDDAAELPQPFDRVLALPFAGPHEPSVHRQLRFFAALEGPAQPFDIVVGGRSVQRCELAAQARSSTMKRFIEAQLVNPKCLFVMRFDDGIKAVIHGEDFTQAGNNLGAWLAHISGEFTAALTQAELRHLSEPDSDALRNLCGAIKGWCLDGSTTMLNQFLRENNMAGIDLSLVPNLDLKETDMDKMYEYVRVFQLHRRQDFLACESRPALDAQGTPVALYLQKYGDMASFRAYLKDQKAFSDAPEEAVEAMLATLVSADMLPADV